MKKFVIGLLIGAILMLSVNVFAAIMFEESNFTLYVDGQKIETPMVISEWVNYIPLRAVTEALGAVVEVDDFRIDITMPKPEPIIAEATPVPTPIPDAEFVAAKCKDSCVMIFAETTTHKNQGSGFIYNGYVVTAKHVIEGAKKIEVYTDGASRGAEATIHYVSPTIDVAVLKVVTGKKSIEVGNPDALKEGCKLIAITSPAGHKNAIDECIYSGIVKDGSNEYMIISESNLFAGSSGGAIFNTKGEVVAMMTNGDKGYGGAMPIRKMKFILDMLK